MIFKILVLGLVIFFIYIVLFRKNRVGDEIKKDKYDSITDEMMECPTCHTFVSKKEAILSNGRYYCSKECLRG